VPLTWVNRWVINASGRVNIHVFSLLLVTLVWGATFPILKIATAQLSGVEVCALRFVIAALCMAPFAWRVPRRTWLDGGLLGALVLVSYVLQAYGLQTISSNRSAFLTSLNVLMVPFLGVLFGNRLRPLAVAAAALACAGIALMSWEGGADLWADLATVLGALGYALYVIVLSHRASHHAPRQLAATQTVWMAVLGCVWMVCSAWGSAGGLETLQSLPQRVDLEIFLGLLYLGAVATAAMLFLQARAQRHVSANQAALIYAMEPVFAAMFAWVWLAEGLGAMAALGAVLVVIAVVLGG
jgi:drug/metabolite transporter (DMT)-like permease